jgi:molecular chaperone GrpE (heat shock protein)
VAARLKSLERTVASLEEVVRIVTRQQDVVHASLRQLSDRVTDAANSLGAPRVRELYLRLLLLYDLVEPPPVHLSVDAKDICEAVSGQIEQFLAVTGFQRIPTDGEAFDRDRHKPVQVVPAKDSNSAGRVLSTIRNGFCSEQAVLRPAEVVIAAGSALAATAPTDAG